MTQRQLESLNNARKPFAVLITPANGTKRYEASRFVTYHEALDYCRNNISYSGNRVRKVDIEQWKNGKRAIWDASWGPEWTPDKIV